MNESRSGGMTIAQVVRIVLFVLAISVLVWLVYTIRGTLLPFGIAFVLSYLLMPLVDYLESHRINRLTAAIGVMITVFAMVGFPLFMVVPTLVSGTQDLVARMVGERGTWSCIVENVGPVPVTLDRYESNLEDFDIRGLPRELDPGERDTLIVGFSPQVYETRAGKVKILGREQDVDQLPILLHVYGNYPLPSDSTVTEPAQLVSLGEAKVAISSSLHAFGVYMPGYLALMKDYNRSTQKRMEESAPILKDFDLAGTINSRLQGMGTSLLEETPQLVGHLLSGLTFLII
ncbi:MAG: AI-2E family transporter, partial [bacterium]|nr:AI-2E family transporter [bacterium]